MSMLQRIPTRVLLKISNCQYLLQKARHNSFKPRKTPGNSIKPRKDVSPLSKTIRDGKSNSASLLLRPFGFAVLVGGASFGGCAIWQYESLRRLAQEMKTGRRNGEYQFIGKAVTIREVVNSYWNRLSPGRKVVHGIIAINIGVFLAWRVKTLSRVMMTYFIASPYGRAPCWSMLFSSWSHVSSWHIFLNMYVLSSFYGIADMFGKEQFLAFYVTAGVVSGFAQYLLAFARTSVTGSVGASGAILAVLGALASQNPDARLSIAFVDKIVPHSFSAQSGIIALICLDTLGILLNWQFFGHAAHLGGTFFGIWYGLHGHKWIWAKRERFVKMWHHYRGKT